MREPFHDDDGPTGESERGTSPGREAARASGLVRIGEGPARGYWRSVEERRGAEGGGPPAGLAEAGPGGLGRRDFLTAMGFSVAAAGVAACRPPPQKAVPLLTGSDRLVPGTARLYATTCAGCASACGLLVKQRDGRPIKVDGNAASPLFGGGSCAAGQATVLSLYDDERLRGPRWRGKRATWADVDGRIREALAAAAASGGGIALLTGTLTSPTSRRVVEALGRRWPTFRHVRYDPAPAGALRRATALAFGPPVLPHYRFDRARVVVALEADFLGTWLSPVEFTRQRAAARAGADGPGLHVQVESGLSVTGTSADVRLAVPPSQVGAVAVALLRRVAARTGAGAPGLQAADPVDAARLDAVAGALWDHRGASLVVCGVQDVEVQVVVHALNALLGNVGATVDLARPSLQRQGDDREMAALVDDMHAGRVRVLIAWGVNPSYDFWDPARFREALARVPLSVSLSERLDETSAGVHAVCPDHHFLEAWGDAEPVASHLSLAQPLIAPLFDTRAAQESLLTWAGEERPDYHAYLRRRWQEEVFPRQAAERDFEAFWDRSLRDGIFDAGDPAAPAPSTALRDGWREAARRVAARAAPGAPAARTPAAGGDRSPTGPGSEPCELLLYESVAVRDGRHANNPWLQELPDPVSKLTWGNCAALAPALADRLGVRTGDVVAVSWDGRRLELPAVVQPGQDPRTVAVALGYGRERAGKVGTGVGANAFGLSAPGPDGERRRAAGGATVARTGRRERLAITQGHFSMEGRPIALEATVEELRAPAPAPEALADLWPGRPHGAHAWGMTIDVDACTGCSACVVACQAENNVPVVGQDQVARERAMHWIRIDHYYRGPEDDPASLHQPMMCQHCAHAPCETVCPVLATTTSGEGLNQQVYNRCIGTRYCANNCPYKVRRFNWYAYTEDATRFDFTMATPLRRMVLNPDVVVRTRGVMEKCSLCVQRIEAGKGQAQAEGRPLRDGEVRTACQEACPAQAITFGDLADPESRASRLARDGRAYRVLEELGTRPHVSYLRRVRRPEDERGKP